MRGFLSSPLAVVGKGLELTRNRLVGHDLDSAEQSRAVLWQPVEGDLEPPHPITVTFAASSEVVDAVLGTKGGSPRAVPDEAKFAITDCASRGCPGSKAFGAVGHCCLLLVSSQLFVHYPFSSSQLMSLCTFPTHAA
jgi:hypothetical protein